MYKIPQKEKDKIRKSFKKANELFDNEYSLIYKTEVSELVMIIHVTDKYQQKFHTFKYLTTYNNMLKTLIAMAYNRGFKVGEIKGNALGRKYQTQELLTYLGVSDMIDERIRESKNEY